MADSRFAALPSVHALADAAGDGAPRWALIEAARRAVAGQRKALAAGGALDASAVAPAAIARAAAAIAQLPLRRVINATGVVLHTNLGRAPLAAAAREALAAIAHGYSNLEYDLAVGERGSRHAHLRATLCELTGAEDAVVANNNAAATVLGLAGLAGGGRQVIVSRGELVEIGGSFRLPDILAMAGGALVEVGTTNKTRASDYERAITAHTGLLLKVHRSNFAIVGFTEEVALAELVAIGKRRGVATMIDLGSGAMFDRQTQRAWGLPAELTVREAVAAGADLVTFSGDKLLGGPQAGIAVGTAAAIAAAKAHPLMRVVRPDKLTIAALGATLASYRDGAAASSVPVARMLAATEAELRARAARIAAELRDARITIEACRSTVGGGAMPLAELASVALVIAGAAPADELAAKLRAGDVPVIATVRDGRVWLDLRTVDADDDATLVAALRTLAGPPP